MTGEPGHVIGLDIGDGESCLAWAPADRSQPTRIHTRPRSGERSIVTAMTRSPFGAGRLIGDEAVTSRGAARFGVNFKTAPDVLSPGIPDAVLFAQTLLAEFGGRHPEVLRDGVVYVGHPAGWSPEVVDAYGRHLECLGVPVQLMPESQSALLHVRDRGRDQRELERVLIVDIGSSTTDFTVVEDLSPRNLPVGAALGCRQIDEQLAGLVRAALSHDAALAEALAGDGGSDFLLLACRWAKEAQFSGVPRRIMDLRESCEERFRPIVAGAWTWLLDLEIPQTVAAPGGWGDRFRTVLVEVADLLGDRPHLLVLTGGGSRMPLAGRLCREVFPTSIVEHDDEPAFAVARGLVSNGQHRSGVRRFRREVSELVEAPATRETVRAEAVQALNTLKDKVAGQMLESHGSAAALTSHIKFGMYEATRALADSLTYYLSMRVERICRRHGVPVDRVRLELALPDLFSDRLDLILDRVHRAERLTEHSTPGLLSQLGVPREAANQAFGSAIERARARFAPSLDPQLASFAIGAVTSSSGLAADRAARRWIQRIVRLGEYTPDELDRITATVMAAVIEQTEDRARDLERWLA
ncbi:Hsp70 family protein [Actinoplanes sp. CA-252034]|uniref:Hsp70 family protein n=1 Tax=Actinoplanes sp. CA-252034 TaxID=3239906 RepID=UPI003D99155D